MKNSIKYLVKYPKLVTLAILAILLFGYMGLTNLRSSFFPIERPRYIFINTTLPGAAPEEIEESIVLKIEENLKSVTGVERITSTSKENFAEVKVELKTQYNPDDILEEVKNAVSSISSCPIDMEPAVIWKEEILTFAMNFAITGSNNLLDLKEEAERIERELMAVDGISKIVITGYPNREIEISLNEQVLRSYQLTFEDIGNAIKNENIDLTGGTIKGCLLYTSPSPRDLSTSRMPSSA